MSYIGANPTLETSIPVYDVNSGLYWKQVWAGTRDAIDALIPSLFLDTDERWDIDDSQTPLFRLTVLTPDYRDGRNNALNKFELVHNKVEKDLFEYGLAKGIDNTSIEFMQKALRDKTGIDMLIAPTEDFVKLYTLYLKGTNKFLTFEHVFRYSIVTSKRFGVLATQNGVEKLWTTDQLTNPNISGLIIPAGTLFSIASLGQTPFKKDNLSESVTVDVTTATIEYKWTWLKQPPDFEQLASGKLVIRQEWYLDLWPTWVYPEYAP